MNPFNQVRYRGEHELGRAYLDVRRAVENLADIKLVADNIKNLRSGNIELSSEGSVLKWKYVNSDEWFDLVDLKVINEDIEQSINTINSTIQNINAQLDNFNGLITTAGLEIDGLTGRMEDVEEFESRIASVENSASTHGSQLSTLTQRIEAVEEFDSRIALLESSITSLISRVEALENAGGGE